MAASGSLGLDGESATTPEWTMTIAQRRAGAPTSQPAVLTLATLSDTHIVAVGSSDGVVALYVLQVNGRLPPVLYHATAL
jgi:hypothetical protein